MGQTWSTFDGVRIDVRRPYPSSHLPLTLSPARVSRGPPGIHDSPAIPEVIPAEVSPKNNRKPNGIKSKLTLTLVPGIDPQGSEAHRSSRAVFEADKIRITKNETQKFRTGQGPATIGPLEQRPGRSPILTLKCSMFNCFVAGAWACRAASGGPRKRVGRVQCEARRVRPLPE